MDNNTIDNQVDGIRKLDNKEMKKSRDLVLSSIGETVVKKKKKQESPMQNKIVPQMDSISSQKDKITDNKIDISKENIQEVINIVEEVDEIIEPVKAKKIVKIEPNKEIEKKEKLVKEIAAIARAKKVEEEAKENLEKKKQEDSEKTERKKLAIKKKKEKENLALKKKQKGEEVKQAEEKLAQEIAKKKQKEKKKKAAEKLAAKKQKEKIKFKAKRKADIKKFIQNFKVSIKDLIKKGFFYSFFVLSVFIFVYLLFSCVVLYLGKGSNIISAASTYVKVPAIVSANGVIYFDEYKKYYTSVVEVKGVLEPDDIIELFVLNNLYEKHNITTMDELLKKLPTDVDVNMAPYNRIKKISNSIVNDSDFVKVVRKYGDVEMLDINKKDLSSLEFGQAIINIEKGETSDVVVTSVGYYIIHCFDIKGDDLSLSYVFIPTVTLDDYLKNSARNFKFWNLTNF